METIVSILRSKRQKVLNICLFPNRPISSVASARIQICLFLPDFRIRLG